MRFGVSNYKDKLFYFIAKLNDLFKEQDFNQFVSD